MTEAEITDGHLRVVVKGFDKVLALRSTLEVPLAQPGIWRPFASASRPSR